MPKIKYLPVFEILFLVHRSRIQGMKSRLRLTPVNIPVKFFSTKWLTNNGFGFYEKIYARNFGKYYGLMWFLPCFTL
jgi:hypothetical protein